MENVCENNEVIICGEITEEFEFSHNVKQERYYSSFVAIERMSGVKDIIPIMVHDVLIDVAEEWKGKRVEICGQFRSHNQDVDGHRKLLLFVFAQEIRELKDLQISDENEIKIWGTVCKRSEYRVTPKGRIIADAMIAVGRGKKSDYLPCIFWGRNAMACAQLSVGDKVHVEGRVQSRIYRKKLEEDEFEIRTAYEVSVSSWYLIEEGEGE